MATVRLEFTSWLTRVLGQSGNGILQEEIQEGETLGNLFDRLGIQYGNFGAFVFDRDSQRIRSGIVVLVNERVIEALGGLQGTVNNDDTVTFLPAYSGG